LNFKFIKLCLFIIKNVLTSLSQASRSCGHGSVGVLERHGNELLGINTVEPVGERTVSAAESILVLTNCLLIVLVVIWCGQPSHVSKIGERVLTSTFTCIYCGHGATLSHFRSLIPQADDVERLQLEVHKVLLLAHLLNIASHRGLIRSVCLLLHLGFCV
jgi:hypothetical protein